jgi:ribonuclease HI/exonuclease III
MTTETEGRQRKIRIWQENVNGSLTSQMDTLNSLNPKHYELILLQEPFYDNTRKTRATPYWNVIYPASYYSNTAPFRSVILVNSKLDTNGWKQIEIKSNDITAIQIKGEFGKLNIFNIYNDCTHSRNTGALENFLLRHFRDETNREGSHMIWAGDFNRHHPTWDEARNHHLFEGNALKEAQVLIDILTANNMKMALPAGIPTLCAHKTKNWTRVDNVFISARLEDKVTKCATLPGKKGVKTDHVPILTELNLEIAKKDFVPSKKFREVKWKNFRKTLERELARIPAPRELLNQEELDKAVNDLLEAIGITIAEQVEDSVPCPTTKRWWTKTLTEMKQKVNQLSESAYRFRTLPNHEIHSHLKKAKDEYAKTIKSTKGSHWKKFLENAYGNDIWTASKYVSGNPTDGGKSRIPSLRISKQNGEHEIIQSNLEKSKAFCRGFFPPPPETLEIDPNQTYPAPVTDFKPITKDQIMKNIKKLKPYKAPGPDGIPNVVLKESADLIADHLLQIFNAIFMRKTYYDGWREYDTVVIRKPGKTDYSNPKAYRPIALLNTLYKLLTAIVTEVLVFIAEKYDLLPKNQFGGRPGRKTTDAMHYLTQKIKNAWRNGKVVSALFLDIEGAFPNAVPERLLHNMKMKGVPEEYVEFIRIMLEGRRTKLKFDDYVSEYFDIENGIGQGDPLSMLLYLFYSGDLVDIPRGKKEDSIAFVDDVTFIAIAPTFEETHEILKNMMTREEGAYTWAKRHNSRFETSKFALIDFSKARQKLLIPGQKKTKPIDRLALRMNGTSIKPVKSHKFLGVIFDQELRWQEQVAQAIGKGSKYTAQIARLSRTATGISSHLMRQMYISAAVAKMTYAADVWYTPITVNSRGRKTGSAGVTKKLASVQRSAALTITGALRSTATDVLDIHANLLPMDLLMDKVCHRSAVRLLSLPDKHPLHASIKHCKKRYVKTHRSPMHELFQAYRLQHTRVETIDTTRRRPGYRKPIITRIADSVEEAVKEDSKEREPGEIRVYSDGSGYEGYAGACAVLIRDDKQKTLKYRLGKLTKHTVYEAEGVAVILGEHLIECERNPRKTSISLDNQAVIRATDKNDLKPGHYVIDEILTKAEHMAKYAAKNYELTIQWIPGHNGNEGNELADKGAKEASQGLVSDATQLPDFLADKRKLPASISALRQAHMEKLQKQWKKRWKTSPRFRKIAAIDPKLPSKRSTNRISHLEKGQSSLIIQLRSGHIALNAFLFKINKSDTDICPNCRTSPETVHHFLFDCMAYGHARFLRYKALGRDSDSLRYLLNTPQGIEQTTIFVNRTNRLKRIFGEIKIAK